MKPPSFHPAQIRDLDSLDIPRGLVSDLMLKRVFLEGSSTLSRMIDETKLDYNVVHDLFLLLQKEQALETTGVTGHNYEFRPTRRGLQMAEEAYRKSRYAGPAPVSLEEYRRAVSEQALKPEISQESLSAHLSDLVLSEDIIRSLGAALMTGGAIFLYGPTGNGKTSIAERLSRIYDDYVYVPYAVEVSGEVLNVFDAIVHRPAEQQPEGVDPRWVLCERPFVLVGGELRGDMLEPHVDHNTHIVRPPVQMKANNGILVIDDFGRQRIPPRELLNRWIVPLDRRVDYLSWFGAAFEIPFELIVVFATNLDLNSLAEEAFIRRLKNKIKIDEISDATFLEILKRQCRERGIAYDESVGEYAVRECKQHSKEGLRACYPRDLLDLICGLAAFAQKPPLLDLRDVDHASSIYFMR